MGMIRYDKYEAGIAGGMIFGDVLEELGEE